ncbi:hypothetical protein LTR36_006892 [Oleoguttula mirabilis]|uniref:Uncharacterized protein n=1 Tax=Oleoguttula mirabilis TaxID=1507867 RepID=A0AAV9JBQ2_9PEZI|nr:hypothetical protein LTR36_006892 [Oleoguttula mirabilis]
MARTRAQDKAGDKVKQESAPPTTAKKSETAKRRQEPEDIAPQEEPKGGEAAEEGEPSEAPPPAKKIKQAEADDDHVEKAAVSVEARENTSKIPRLLGAYGAIPLENSGLSEPHKPTAETMFAHLLNAMLTTTRISQQIAAKTVRTVIAAGYADLQTLEKSSWEERTKVLTDGGYTHYREKTATQLGDLAELVRGKYEGDLSNLLKAAKEEAGSARGVTEVRDGVRKRLQEVKGLGNVALDVFCDSVQGLWTELAPFLDSRSAKAAGTIGLPIDVQELYEAVGENPVEMCKLASALTTVRLDKKEREFW